MFAQVIAPQPAEFQQRVFILHVPFWLGAALRDFPDIAIFPILCEWFGIYVMRNVVLVAFVAWVATTSWAQSSEEAKSETLLRWSFAGTREIAADKDLKVFNTVRALPEAAALRDAAATNLAHAAAARFTARGNTNARPQIVALIHPLVPDLVQNESRFQMHTQGAQDADWFLAIKLPNTRSQHWGKSFAQLATLSGMKGASVNNSQWIATRDNYKLSFSRSNDWTVIEGGYGGPESKSAKAFRATLGKARGETVLDAEINAPLLAKIWSAPNLAHYPKLTVKAEPRNDGFQSELILDYPQDLGIKPEKWNVPAEIINDPLIGFTAVQGLQEKLESVEKFKALGAKQTPNQFFLWNQGISPFSVAMAAEVKNPAEVVSRANTLLQKSELPTGDLEVATNRSGLLWRGLPIVVPFLEPAPEPRNSFLLAGLFPVKANDPKPAPADLLEQLNQKNLVYYDWELTSERIQQWIPIWQLYYLIGGHFAPDNGAPSSKLLQKLKTQLGNTITTGTLESPRRIKFTRQSHLGASALELVLLSHYLDSSDLRAIRTPRDRRAMPAPPAP